MHRLSAISQASASPRASWDSRTAEELFAPPADTAFDAELNGWLDDEGRLPFAQTIGWLALFAILGWGIVVAIGLLLWSFIR